MAEQSKNFKLLLIEGGME